MVSNYKHCLQDKSINSEVSALIHMNMILSAFYIGKQGDCMTVCLYKTDTHSCELIAVNRYAKLLVHFGYCS